MQRLLAISCLLIACDAGAATCNITVQESADATVTHVASLSSANDCFGGKNDTHALAKRILSDVAQPSPSMRTTEEVNSVKAAAIRHLELIQTSLVSSATGTESPWNASFAVVQSRLAEASAQVASLEARVTPTFWEYNDLSFFDSTLELAPAIREACADPDGASCSRATTAATTIVRHANLTHAVLNRVLVELRLRDLYEEVTALDDQWDNYFTNGRSQYVWELLVNSWRYQRDLCKGVSRERCASILAPPPTDQLILLHPTAALEYVRDVEDDYNAVAIIELVGYNRWTKASSRLGKFALGASLIATVSPGSQGERVGWGAMAHVNNKYSFGAARRDVGMGTETVWLVSVDIGKLITKVDAQARNAFRFSGE